MDCEKAKDTSEILVEADMMGHSTHGVRLLPLYIKDIEAGNLFEKQVKKLLGGQKLLNRCAHPARPGLEPMLA